MARLWGPAESQSQSKQLRKINAKLKSKRQRTDGDTRSKQEQGRPMKERVLESVRMETDPHRPPSGRTGVLTAGSRFRPNPANSL